MLHEFDSENQKIIITNYSVPLIRCLNLDNELHKQGPKDIINGNDSNVLQTIHTLSGIKISRRAPTRIGASMGRPEKAKERMMKPPVHVLFPLGNAGGTQRLVKTAAEHSNISVEIGMRHCTKCGNKSIFGTCDCGGHTIINSGKPVNNNRAQMIAKQTIPIKQMLYRAQKNLNISPIPDIKGVIGLI